MIELNSKKNLLKSFTIIILKIAYFRTFFGFFANSYFKI